MFKEPAGVGEGERVKGMDDHGAIGAWDAGGAALRGDLRGVEARERSESHGDPSAAPRPVQTTGTTIGA